MEDMPIDIKRNCCNNLFINLKYLQPISLINIVASCNIYYIHKKNPPSNHRKRLVHFKYSKLHHVLEKI